MGTITQIKTANINLSMSTTLKTLYKAVNDVWSVNYTKFVSFRASSRLSGAFINNLSGGSITACTDAYDYEKQDDYESADATARAWLEVKSDGHLYLQTRQDGGSVLSHLLIQSNVVDVDNLNFSSTWTKVFVSGEDSWSHTDQSSMNSGSVYDAATQANTGYYWQVRAHVNADTFHSANSETYLKVALRIYSKVNNVDLLRSNFLVRAKARSD
jgi:hypothetical protein